MDETCGNFSYEKTFIASVDFEFSIVGKSGSARDAANTSQYAAHSSYNKGGSNVGVTNHAEN